MIVLSIFRMANILVQFTEMGEVLFHPPFPSFLETAPQTRRRARQRAYWYSSRVGNVTWMAYLVAYSLFTVALYR